MAATTRVLVKTPPNAAPTVAPAMSNMPHLAAASPTLADVRRAISLRAAVSFASEAGTRSIDVTGAKLSGNVGGSTTDVRIIAGAVAVGPLRLLHSSSSSTVNQEGAVMQGNARLIVLQERGYDSGAPGRHRLPLPPGYWGLSFHPGVGGEAK